MWSCSCGHSNPSDLTTCERCYSVRIATGQETPDNSNNPRSTSFSDVAYTDPTLPAGSSFEVNSPVVDSAEEDEKAKQARQSACIMIYCAIALSIAGCFFSWFLGFNHHSGYRASLAVDLVDNFTRPAIVDVYFGRTCQERDGFHKYQLLGWEEVADHTAIFQTEKIKFSNWRGHALCVRYTSSLLDRPVATEKVTTNADGSLSVAYSCPEDYTYCGKSQCVPADGGKCPLTHFRLENVSNCNPKEISNGTCINNRLSGIRIVSASNPNSYPLVALRINSVAIPYNLSTSQAAALPKVCDRATIKGPLDPICVLETPIPLFFSYDRPERPAQHPEYTLANVYPSFQHGGTVGTLARLASFHTYADNFLEPYAWRDVVEPASLTDSVISTVMSNIQSQPEAHDPQQVPYPALFAKSQTPFLFSSPSSESPTNCTISMVQTLVDDRESFELPLDSSTWWLLLPLAAMYTVYSFCMILPSTSPISIFSAKNAFYGSTLLLIASFVCGSALLVKGMFASSNIPILVDNVCLSDYMLDVMQYDVVEGLQTHTLLVAAMAFCFLFDIFVRMALYFNTFKNEPFDYHIALTSCCSKRNTHTHERLLNEDVSDE